MRHRPLLLFAPLLFVPSLAIAQVDAGPAAAGANPIALVNTAVDAGAAHDWQILAASVLCIVAWALRRFSASPVLHTKAAALVTSIVMGVISAILPVLQAHAFTWRALVVAVVAAVLSLVAMSNPSESQFVKAMPRDGVPPVVALLFAFLAPSIAHAAGNMPHTVADLVSGGIFLVLTGAATFVFGILGGQAIERRGVPRSIARNRARWLGGSSASIVLLACGAASAAPGFGLVLQPGAAELERNRAGVGDVRSFNPCELGPTRWLDRSCERELLLAQADEMPVTPPAAAPAQVVETPAAPAPVIAPEKPPAPPAAEKPPAQALDPRRAISNGATSQTVGDCARCVTGGVALYKQKGGPLAIAGMALGTLLDLTALVIPMLTAQGKPETDPMMAGATP